MLTWSSASSQVGIESTEAGWLSVLFSETSAAAVYWASINPDRRPTSLTRNGGRPLLRWRDTRWNVLRSEMFPTSARARHAWSSATATGSPWKLPPETTARLQEATVSERA